MGKVNISQSLIKDLQKYGSQVSVGIAAEVRDELVGSASDAIEAFYRDYTPVYYKRHYYNFRKNSYIKYYNNPHNMIVRGGVLLSPDDMDDVYEYSKEEVFDSVMHGYHGRYGNVTPMSPSPLELIQMSRDNIVNNIGSYKIFGINRANKVSYDTLTIK